MLPTSDKLPSPFKVLVIEDSVTVRTFLRLWLTSEVPGAEVIEAEDGKTAFNALGRHSVHLIITDLNMPGMDGMTFLEKLRANPVLKRKPVMVLSGNLTSEIQRAMSSDPLLLAVSKPAGIETLNETLHTLQARASRGVAAAV